MISGVKNKIVFQHSFLTLYQSSRSRFIDIAIRLIIELRCYKGNLRPAPANTFSMLAIAFF
jgi:hypothetical protein